MPLFILLLAFNLTNTNTPACCQRLEEESKARGTRRAEREWRRAEQAWRRGERSKNGGEQIVHGGEERRAMHGGVSTEG